MGDFALRIAGLICLLVPSFAFADQWVSYTDGRAGGCWINSVGVLYGCTPQSTPHTPNGAARSATSEEDRCRRARLNLKNAKNNFNRTITSVRDAEARFARTGCEEAERAVRLDSTRQSPNYEQNYALIEQRRRNEEERARLVLISAEPQPRVS